MGGSATATRVKTNGKKVLLITYLLFLGLQVSAAEYNVELSVCDCLALVDRCRRDLHTVLQWGVRSLDELQDVIDETMADELACMVREKMLRILSDMADFEEAAEEFERTMTQGAAAASVAGQRHTPETPTAPEHNDDRDDTIPQRLSGTYLPLLDSEI